MELGPYELCEKLGEGGMGVVWRARHIELGHEVALKVVSADEELSSELTDRFRRETQAAAALRGTPGIVGVRDSGVTADGAPWFAMDLIRGTTLESCVASGELAAHAAAELIALAADAVHAAHEQGLIHRDLKPANILLDVDGNPWVTDFGLVRSSKPDAGVARLTRTGEIIGTPAYMAAEQVLGGTIDARTDVYGLGATLFEVLTGCPPFDGETMLAVLQGVLTDRPDWRLLREAGGDGGLRRVLESALARDPDARYDSAAAFAADLRRWAAGEGVHARAVRRGTGAVLLFTALGVAVAGSAALWWGSGPPSGEPSEPDQLTAVTAERAAAEVAAARFRAYVEVDQATGQPVARLQARWFGAPVPAAEVAAATAAVETAVRAAGPDAQAHAAAWRMMAAYFGGDEAALGRLAEAAQTAGPDPFPRLIHARVQLARYLDAVGLPGAAQRALPSAVDFVESDDARARRADFDAALQAVRDAEWWSLAPKDPFVEQLGEIATALGTSDHEAVYAAADLLARHPGLAPVALDLSAFARFQLRDFAAAGDAWAGLIERLGVDAWPALHRRAAKARGWQATEAKEPEVKQHAAEQAIAHAGAALAADPTDVAARLARLSAYSDLGRSIGGAAGRAYMVKAVADGDFLVEITGGSATTLYERALALTIHGFLAMRMLQYADADRIYARAQSDADRLVTINPGSRRAHSIRSLAYEMQAALDDRSKRDSRPALRAVTESLRVMVQIRPDRRAQERLLQHSSHLAWSEVRYGGDPADALKSAEALLARAPAGTKSTNTAIDFIGRTYVTWGHRQERGGVEDPTYAWMRAAEIYGRNPVSARGQIARLTGLALLVRWSKERGRLDAAQTAYALQAAADAAARLPADLDVHLMRGGLLESLGRFDDAIAAYDRVLELKPGHPLALRERAKVHAARGK